ncbi:hypothetical protein VQ056_21585 [Paenibacillus sp. JTLBN-2024]
MTSVTQQEAVTMAIRFAGLWLKVDKNASVALPCQNMQVNNYFKPYVALAIQQNLLDKTSENAASDSSRPGANARQTANGSPRF